MQRFRIGWAGWIGGTVVAAAAWIGGGAIWLAVHDPVDFDARHRAALAEATAGQDRAQAALTVVQSRLAGLQAELAATEERRRTATRALASLRAGDHWWSTVWDKLFGDSAEVRTREERLARLEQAEAAATARIAELRPAVTRTIWERDGAEIDLERVNRRLAAVTRDNSKAQHYLSLAWRTSRGYVVLGLAAWFCAPLAWRLRRQSRS